MKNQKVTNDSRPAGLPSRLERAIKCLEKRKDEIKNELKSGNRNLLDELKEINKAINWIIKIDELKLKEVKKYEIIKLPDPQTGSFSEYRIMNDCETENKDFWIELKINNSPARVSHGDLIIREC